MSYLIYLCLFACSDVQHIALCFLFCLSSSCVLNAQYCQFLWFVHFWMRLWFLERLLESTRRIVI
jgi:hypothetical protein